MTYSSIPSVDRSPMPLKKTPVSPYTEAMKELVNTFDLLLTNFLGFSEPESVERDWDDIFAGEFYGYLSAPEYDSDPGKPQQVIFKILRFTLILRGGYASEREAKQGAAAMALAIEHGIQEVKQQFPHDFGMIWDIIIEGSIQPFLLASVKEPRVWTVEIVCKPLIRLVVQTLLTGSHDEPPLAAR